jgi:phosphoglycolate phosphatase-like HAD superfamily hydrolase
MASLAPYGRLAAPCGRQSLRRYSLLEESMTGGALAAQCDAVLFDIDGTLLIDSSAHLAILADTLARRVGGPVTIDLDGERPRLDGREISGWIDAQVVRFVLAKRLGPAVDDADVHRVIEDYGNAYRSSIRSASSAGRPVDGAAPCLERLRSSGVRLGLVTGNASVVARAKLEAVGFASFFDFDPDLGFGDWRADRAAVARAAVQGLERAHGTVRAIAMVGDTATDMRAATGVGARAIGVSTGAASEGELVEAGATIVLASVADL